MLNWTLQTSVSNLSDICGYTRTSADWPGFYAYDTFDYIETRLGIKKKPPEL